MWVIHAERTWAARFEHRCEANEKYASDMLSLAAYVVDVAENAVDDAAIARTEAGELAART